MSAEHVIFGTGPVGLATMHALLRRGDTVTVVNRTGRAPVPDNVQVIAGDARDSAFTVDAARGARVVYQTLNPSYHEWATQFPLLQSGVLAAAEKHGALYVNMDNVYSYGRPRGHILTEESPEKPHTRKGQVRHRMAQELFDAHRAGRVAVTSGRASDYFGPGGGEASPLGTPLLKAVVAGETARVFGNPDYLHSYTFLPDIGEALAVLGTDPRAIGSVWHLPNDPDTRTTRQIVETLFELAGTRGRIRSIGRPTLAIGGLFNRTVRELIEMAYEFDEDFVVDSTRITQFGLHATPIDEALERSLAAHVTGAR